MDSIRTNTHLKLELRSSIAKLKGMTLNEQGKTLIPTTISLYENKIKLYDESIKISNNILATDPKAGADYSKMLPRTQEITASIDRIDESIFQSMLLVFALLVDEKPDREGHMSRLIITKAQKQNLIADIDLMFGESLDKETKNWTVSSAALLKWYLKGYKCKDEYYQNEKGSPKSSTGIIK